MNTRTQETYFTNGKYTIPREYIEWQAGVWIELEWSYEAIQAKLLYSLFISGVIHPFGVHELERIQEQKEEEYGFFSRRGKSIPLLQIASFDEVETLITKLTQIGAKSTIFEKYAWWYRLSRSTP